MTTEEGIQLAIKVLASMMDSVTPVAEKMEIAYLEVVDSIIRRRHLTTKQIRDKIEKVMPTVK